MTRVFRPWQILAIAFALAAAALIPSLAPHDHSVAAVDARTNRAAFHDAMRQLWEDHIVWTRMFIVSAVSDLPDVNVAADRLLSNQDDIGDAIRPFYGDAAGDQLSTLLREHITGAATLLDAARTGDSDGVGTAATAWYENGDAIAAFLSQANPRAWPLAEMRSMMRDHLDLTLEEAVARLEGRFADDVAAYDRIHVQILHMADMLSNGILAQFPARFAP